MRRTIGLGVAAALVISAGVWGLTGKTVEGYYGDMVLNNKAEQRGMPSNNELRRWCGATLNWMRFDTFLAELLGEA